MKMNKKGLEKKLIENEPSAISREYSGRYSSFLLYSTGLMGGSALTVMVSGDNLKEVLVTLSVAIASGAVAYIVHKCFYITTDSQNIDNSNIIHLDDYRRKQ